MGWIDWSIVIIPMLLLLWMAFYSGKYVRGIVDYLAAGRIAGRYVLSVGDMASALSVITLVATCEQNYQTGFSVGFWSAITAPVGMFMALSGFVVYRWRQTRCLSFGQFIELRYGSKFFRIFCAVLRSLAEMVTNAIGPAIATNFFIYYLGLPHKIMIGGVNLPTFAIIVVLCLTLAVLFIWPGGRISLLITDSFQALLCYPIFVVIVGYIILNFSWHDDIAVTMWNRVPGESFMNPYDISQLRDFNIFAIMVSLIGSVVNRGAWIGNDTSGAAKTPHEQKMASVLGTWRSGFSWTMMSLIAMIVIVFMNSSDFYGKNRFGVTNIEIRQKLTARVLDEVVESKSEREKIMTEVRKIPSITTVADIKAPVSQKKNMDTVYFSTVQKAVPDTPEGRYHFQKFRATYNQMMMPLTLRNIFPVGMIGIFCLLMVMLLISTDDSRIFNASSTLMQDVLLPLFKGHLSAKVHLLMLRLMTLAVAIFFLIVSLFFAQLDYITMFTTIMCALWTGGAGPIVLFGLYSRFGNLTGAWCAIIFGSGTSLFGLICQRNWALTIYPFLERMGWVEGLNNFLVAVSSPFNPWIVWKMDPVKFPINSFEIYFISMILSIATYVLGSYLTYKPYNLDKLLHRGEYADENTPVVIPEKWTVKNTFRKLLGITPEYTTGDKVIAYSVFYYTIVYRIGIVFVAIVIMNLFWRWPNSWWTWKFFITTLLIPGIVGIVTTVWFLWGGIRDMRRLFIDLKHRVDDPNDNGQVFEKIK